MPKLLSHAAGNWRWGNDKDAITTINAKTLNQFTFLCTRKWIVFDLESAVCSMNLIFFMGRHYVGNMVCVKSHDSIINISLVMNIISRVFL